MFSNLNSGSWHFLRLSWKTKNKFRFSEDFLAQYLISKEFLEYIGYIFNYLLKSEQAQQTGASKNPFFKNLDGPFLWMGFHCVKATEPQRGDSLLCTTKYPGASSIHLIHLGRMKGWVNLGVTEWFWIRDP